MRNWTREVVRLYLNQHVPVFDLQRVHRDFSGRVMRGFAARRIPRPAVQGTYDLAVLDRSFTERTASVQAHVVHRAVRAIHIGDADGLSVAREFLGLVVARKVGLRSELGEHKYSAFRAQPLIVLAHDTGVVTGAMG